MSFVNVNGKEIFYEEYGVNHKQIIVYFHGGPGESCLTYTHQAKILGERYHVISFDQYGVFRSEAIPDNQPFGVRDHAELIERMRIALNVSSWSVLGHSYGGMLACLYAYLYPNSVNAVIYDCPMWNVLLTSKTIAATTLPFYEANAQIEKIQLCHDILSDTITPKEAFDKAMLLEMTAELKDFCHVIENSVYEQYITNFIPQVDVPQEDWYKFINFTKMLLEKGDYYNDYLPYLSEIKKPSLLMVGEYDMTCGRDQQEWFCKYAKNGKFIILKNSAHLSWMQVPEEYTSVVSEFMDALGT